MAKWASLFDPHVEKHLLWDEGERIQDEVLKHPICMVKPGFWTLVGVGIILLSTIVPVGWWLLVIVGVVVCSIGLYRFHLHTMDRFVITNTRVFRVQGVFDRKIATVPLNRLLDISVNIPPWGMVFHYGHFMFESAAQDQSIREIKYVPNPQERDLLIQRVIQRAGLRAMAAPSPLDGS